jgi:ABC-type amino acid transport system permease subunit
VTYNFQFRDVLAQKDAIFDGLMMTLQLSAITIGLGFILGIAVAVSLVYGSAWLRGLGRRSDTKHAAHCSTVSDLFRFTGRRDRT